MCVSRYPYSSAARNTSDGALISEHLPAAPLVPDARASSASCASSAAPATEGDGEEGDGAGPESLLFVVKELPELAGSTGDLRSRTLG